MRVSVQCELVRRAADVGEVVGVRSGVVRILFPMGQNTKPRGPAVLAERPRPPGRPPHGADDPCPGVRSFARCRESKSSSCMWHVPLWHVSHRTWCFCASSRTR